jgi:hypothetical protein
VGCCARIKSKRGEVRRNSWNLERQGSISGVWDGGANQEQRDLRSLNFGPQALGT